MNIVSELFKMQDLEYKKFHSKLMPEIEDDKIIGVRTPQLRKFAKEINGTETTLAFLKKLPHHYYEENNLHAFIIEKTSDFNVLLEELDAFLPWVDNWATCDMMSPKAFKKNLPELIKKVKLWLDSEDTYTVRFGIVTLMKYYLKEGAFNPEYAGWVGGIAKDEYYIKMAVAWYFATALAYQYDSVIHYLTDNILDKWTHNKAVQKAIESNRISDSCKQYLKTLRR